jgi:hypothetical protein
MVMEGIQATRITHQKRIVINEKARTKIRAKARRASASLLTEGHDVFHQEKEDIVDAGQQAGLYHKNLPGDFDRIPREV